MLETAFTPSPPCTQTSGVNTRVHEGCHAEVGQDEEEDQAIVERHSGRDYLCQPGAPRDTKEGTEIRIPSIVLHFVTFQHSPNLTIGVFLLF